jgi:hypothetical protein
MLKARPIPALVVMLKEKEAAVFIQSGSWNGLTEYLCAAPTELAGEKMITVARGSRHHFTEMFATITGGQPDPLEVVMASPPMERALKEAEAHFAAKDQAKEAAETPNT